MQRLSTTLLAGIVLALLGGALLVTPLIAAVEAAPVQEPMAVSPQATQVKSPSWADPRKSDEFHQLRLDAPGTTPIRPSSPPLPAGTSVPTPCSGGVNITGAIDNSDPIESQMVAFYGPRSLCQDPRSCPGAVGLGETHYDEYTFVNDTGATRCVTVAFNSMCGNNEHLMSSAHLGSYDPNNACANYLGDAGVASASGHYTFYVPAGATFAVVVEEIHPGRGCQLYTLSISGCPGGPTPTPTPACGLAWRDVPTPGSGNLLGIEAISPNDIWAVGYKINPTEALTQHWDGTSLSVVLVPAPSEARLRSVAAVSANDIWAVGDYGEYTHSRTLIEHWDGTSWTHVPSPNIGTDRNVLHDVVAIAPNDVWAVGYWWLYDNNQTITLHWNGIEWSIVPSPNTYRETTLFGVTATASNDVWAVGEQWANGARTFTMHWDGEEWSEVPAPNPGNLNDILYAVESLAPDDVWATGGYNSRSGSTSYRTFALHWDGITWNHVPSPNANLSDNYIWDISAIAPNDIWAFGEVWDDTRWLIAPIILHWDGGTWSMTNVYNFGSECTLRSGTSLSHGNVWAAGTCGGYVQSLIKHYDDPCSITPMPITTLTPTPNHTRTPTLTPTSVPSTATPVVTRVLTPTPCAVEFNDVPPGSTFYPYIHCITCRGIISGYSDGTFRPNNLVTRGQLAKMVSNAAGFTESPDPQIFEDVSPTNTFYEWINRLARRGHMSGYVCGGVGEPCTSGMPYFRPSANATRGQTSKIVSNAAGYTEIPTDQTFEDVPPTHTFYREIQRLASRNIMQGYPCGGTGEPCLSGKPYFRPANNVTRGQSAKIVANTFYPNCETP